MWYETASILSWVDNRVDLSRISHCLYEVMLTLHKGLSSD